MTPVLPGLDRDSYRGEQPAANLPRGVDNTTSPVGSPVVAGGAATTGQALVWNGVTGLWEPASIASGAESVTETMLTAALRNKLNPSAWEAIPFTAQTVQAAGFLAVAVRTEDGGTMARLRGVIAVAPAKEIATGETVFTVPVGFRPASPVLLTTSFNLESAPKTTTLLGLQIAATGVCTFLQAANLAANTWIRLDGLTYSLT